MQEGNGNEDDSALEQAENRIAEALKQQGREEPILLKGSDADGLLLRLPEGMKDSDVRTLRGLREAIIEKDYYVTEALRIIEQAAGPQVIFKGGTSLSKGWGLIQRFSEDIDIFLDPTAFEPPLGKKAIDRELKKLRQADRAAPGTDLRREGEPDHRRLRPQRPLRVCPAIRRGRRHPQPRLRRGRHCKRPGTDRTRPAPVLCRAIPRGKRGHSGSRGRRPVRDAAAPFPRGSSAPFFGNSRACKLMVSRDGPADETPSSSRECGFFRSGQLFRFPGSSRLALTLLWRMWNAGREVNGSIARSQDISASRRAADTGVCDEQCMSSPSRDRVHWWTFAGNASEKSHFVSLFGPLGVAFRWQRSIRKPRYPKQIGSVMWSSLARKHHVGRRTQKSHIEVR